MGWVLRKLDLLIGAVVVGAAGTAVSQLQAFIQQYLQRLGGHLDEAQRNHQTILESERYQAMEPASRDLIVNDALARVDEIKTAYDAVVGADLFTRPYAFLTHMDTAIAGRTLESFKPALPVDSESLIYAGVGLLIGFLVYELVKAPFGLVFRKRKKIPQREKKRPAPAA